MNAPNKQHALKTETRALIVRQLGAALANAWRRQREVSKNDERPDRLNHAAGRDVRGKGGREHHERYHTRSVE
jgi:hypothetical protein